MRYGPHYPVAIVHILPGFQLQEMEVKLSPAAVVKELPHVHFHNMSDGGDGNWISTTCTLLLVYHTKEGSLIIH